MWTEGAMTQAQIGAALGITAQRVSAILTRYRDSLATCPACGQEVQPDRWSAAELAELAKLPHVAGARGNPCTSY